MKKTIVFAIISVICLVLGAWSSSNDIKLSEDQTISEEHALLVEEITRGANSGEFEPIDEDVIVYEEGKDISAIGGKEQELIAYVSEETLPVEIEKLGMDNE